MLPFEEHQNESLKTNPSQREAQVKISQKSHALKTTEAIKQSCPLIRNLIYHPSPSKSHNVFFFIVIQQNIKSAPS